MSGLAATTPLDALSPCAGSWSNGTVTVSRGGPARLRGHRTAGRLVVRHRLTPYELDDDLAGLLTDELGALLHGPEDFRRVFTGIVCSTLDDPLAAWRAFYANTLAALASGRAAFAPVHQRALAWVRGPGVLDLGSCFGFLALRLAEFGHRVTATDLCPGTVGLLATVAGRTGSPLSAAVCDAAAIPLASGSVDTVAAIHLLEHLSPAHGAAVLAEAVRVARHRVIIAVPFEDEPEPLYGHVRCLRLDALHDLGRASGLNYRVEQHHGGWLVVDL